MLLRQWTRIQIKPTEFVSDILENRLSEDELIVATECVGYVSDVSLAIQAILHQLKHDSPAVREAAITALRAIYVSKPDFTFGSKIQKRLHRISRKDCSPVIRKAAKYALMDFKFKGKKKWKIQ